MTRPNSGRLWRLCQKELRETLRDRRTLVTLVLMPLLLYPLLSMTLQRFLMSVGVDDTAEYRIGVEDESIAGLVESLLRDARSQPPEEVMQAAQAPLAKLEVYFDDQLGPESLLELGLVDVALITHPGAGPGEPPTWQLVADGSESASLAARRVLVERTHWFRLAIAEQRLVEAGDQAGARLPRLTLRTFGQRRGESMLATLVPLVLVLMTITGAVYPAIDLTAGERERGTIEMLIASPVPRGQVLFAKYTAVVSVALLTALVNLVAMLTTLKAGGMMAILTGGDEAIPWGPLGLILLLLVLFSGFFAAVLLCLTSFARSFKEAQAYLIPLMLLALLPGVLSLIPGVELTPTLAVLPLVNIVLLTRELLAGSVQPMAAGAAVLSTIAYAAGALGLASRFFGTDVMLRGSEVSAGALLRRPQRSSEVPALSAAGLVLAAIFPVYFWVSNALAQANRRTIEAAAQDGVPADLSGAMLTSGLALGGIFAGIPILAAWLARNRLSTTMRLQWSPPGGRFLVALCGAAVIGLGLWVWGHESFVVTARLDEQRIESARQMLERLQQVPFWVVLLSLAIAPGIFEELCFRGYLFSACQRMVSPAKSIMLTSVVFGLFHVLTGNVLLVERFVPTTLIGLVLGWIAYRSGSVWPGVVLHIVHNALLNSLARFKDQLAFLGAVEDEVGHLPPSWLAAGTILVLAGMGLFWIATRPVVRPHRRSGRR